jgi:hypothetical protein
VFLEQDIDHPVGSRYNRWWLAYGGGGAASLPLVMVDSGHQISNGSVSFYNVYKGMVDTELALPPKAYIRASCGRVGNQMRVSGQITNLSGGTLSSSGNGATIHAIVYEDAHVGVTDRYVRDVPSIAIASGLANGETMTFTLETTDLTGVNWDKLHAVVLADYRPAGSSGPYDMLQSTRTSEAGLSDAIVAMQVIAGITPSQDINKNVNLKGDGKIGLPEAIYILQVVAGMR